MKSCASAACDTRQAKRLFPLFSAGGIIGAIEILGVADRDLRARMVKYRAQFGDDPS